MNLHIPRFRIEHSVFEADKNNQLESQMSKLINQLTEYNEGDFTQVSGQPLHVWQINGNEFHFDECSEFYNRAVIIGRISWSNIHDPSNCLPSRYTMNSYPVLSCIDLDNTEYSMGMHSVFGFELEHDAW